MNFNHKAAAVDNALNQLSAEIASDVRYDHPTAVIAFSAIDSFIYTASAESKERLYDILKGA